MEDDLEFIMHISEDRKEVTIVLRSPKPLTTGDLVLELEQYLLDLSRAEEQRQGVETH